ncbi:MAG: helix-turn-helix transcriptional regulator [Caulobacterales bacterium]|nr:helix-turn-helix transcriptional regulator [Caulobacterales bacterium]
MTTLEVHFLRLAECLVSEGWRLEIPGTDAPGIHYNVSGVGTLTVGEHPPIPIMPHTLVIIPPGKPFWIDVASDRAPDAPPATVEAQWRDFAPGALRRFVAGHGDPNVILICGYFRAAYGASMDLFRGLQRPIVEQFDESHQLDAKLRAALAELVAQEVGMGAMTTTLLKQVLVALLRRSLNSMETWVERFSMLSDPHVAKAFAEMAAHPGAPHTIQSLSQRAGLSRSAFMARFARSVGRAPMVALREMRMRQAASMLTAGGQSIEQIAQAVGYTNRSSFMRAFRQAMGVDPTEYRTGGASSPRDDAR